MAWEEWVHTFKSWLVFANGSFEHELKVVEDNPQDPIVMSTLPPDTASRSNQLYAIFTSLLRGKPKTLLRSQPGPA